jgi:hypothetical protein
MWSKFNAWLKDLASTNFKIVIGAFLAVCTMFFYFGSEMRCIAYTNEGACRRIDTSNFVAWLSFVAAVIGVAYLQFAKKRDTYTSPGPDSERAGVPTEPAPTTPKES